MLRTARSSQDVQRVPVHPQGLTCPHDKHVALYVAPSKDVLELVEDMIAFVLRAECTCYPAQGKYDGHTCSRCTLLARLGEPQLVEDKG